MFVRHEHIYKNIRICLFLFLISLYDCFKYLSSRQCVQWLMYYDEINWYVLVISKHVYMMSSAYVLLIGLTKILSFLSCFYTKTLQNQIKQVLNRCVNYVKICLNSCNTKPPDTNHIRPSFLYLNLDFLIRSNLAIFQNVIVSV